jgi:hypothetical protein
LEDKEDAAKVELQAAEGAKRDPQTAHAVTSIAFCKVQTPQFHELEDEVGRADSHTPHLAASASAF